MKKVIVYQAKDGSTHATPTACKTHDAKLAIKPAAEAFVATLGSETAVIDVANGLADFIADNADALRKVLTEPLIVRKPRKAKAAATPAPAKKEKPAPEVKQEAAQPKAADTSPPAATPAPTPAPAAAAPTSAAEEAELDKLMAELQ